MTSENKQLVFQSRDETEGFRDLLLEEENISGRPIRVDAGSDDEGISYWRR